MDNHFYYLLCAAVAPVIAGLGYIFAKDRYNREPLGMLLGAFFCGVVSIIPICIVEGILEPLIGLFAAEPSPLFKAFWTAFIVAACTEEFFKLCFLHGFIWKSPEFDERFDGIVYGVFVSLGFACAENIGYVFGSLSEGGLFAAYHTSIVRAIFSIPCHFFCGVILGYYLSLAKFEKANQNNESAQSSVIYKGLFYSILFHGIYDFILFYQSYSCSQTDETQLTSEAVAPGAILFIMFLVFNIVFWKIGGKRIKHFASLLQPDSKNEQEAFVTCSFCGNTYESHIPSCPNCKQLTEKSIQDQNEIS